MNSIQNILLSPMSFIIDVGSHAGKYYEVYRALEEASSFIPRNEKVLTNKDFRLLKLTESFEISLREMISKCTIRLKVPHIHHSLDSPRIIKRSLSPSLRNRISFVDRRGKTLDAVRAYLSPITEDYASQLNPNESSGDLSLLAWHLYLLCLGAKMKAEVPFSPNDALDNLNEIGNWSNLTPESKARIAIISGLFRSFSQKTEVPSIRFLPKIPAFAISERIDEILEDAYLLEASRLRRFLGLNQNVNSVKRDLRLIIKAIRDNSKWARGILDICSGKIIGSSDISGVAQNLLEIIPELPRASYPILSPFVEPYVNQHQVFVEFRPGIGSHDVIVFVRGTGRYYTDLSDKNGKKLTITSVTASLDLKRNVPDIS